jgi:exodeoxyribonuclease VII large subunit
MELISQVQEGGVRLGQSINRMLSENKLHLAGLARGLPNLTQLVEQKQQDLDGLSERLGAGPARLLAAKGQELSVVAAGLKTTHLARDVKRYDSQILDLSNRLGTALKRSAERTEERLAGIGARLESVSPKRVLERGYALVRDADGNPITVAAGAPAGAAWQVEFTDGTIDVHVGDGVPNSKNQESTSPKPHPKPKTKVGDKVDGRQGSLL